MLKKSLLAILGFCSAEAYVIGMDERQVANTPTHKVSKANTFEVDIGHRFTSTLDTNGNFSPIYKDVLGMDGNANIAIATRFGIGNLMDFSFERHSLDKNYILRNKINFLNQNIDTQFFSLSTETLLGYKTQDALSHRLNWGLLLLLNKGFFNESFVFGVLGAYTSLHSNKELNKAEATYMIGANSMLRLDRWSIGLEYSRPLTGHFRENLDGLTTDVWGAALQYRTYQHLFKVTLQNHSFNSWNEFAAGAQNVSNSDTDIRFGFNIIRELDFLNNPKPSKR